MDMLQDVNFWLGLVKVIWINIILSGDNAVVIALAARSLPAHQQNKAVLIGSGAAVVLLIGLTVIAAKLLANGNKLTAVLAPGKIGKIFIEKELQDMGVEVHSVESMRRNGLGMLSQWLGGETKPDLVVSAGPDEQHHAVINAMDAAGVNLPMAVTNNATMCCGEGICGACECETQDGHTVKLCKVQTGFSQLVT